MAIDPTKIRSQFPSLLRKHDAKPLIYLDGPGGTQVPSSVMEAISNYYKNSNTNTHGLFVTSRETDDMILSLRKSVATFLGAEGPHTISVGQNMTTLNYALARGIARILQNGDEVLITQLDHEGNRGPWLSLREHGVVVKEVSLKKDGTLDYDDFEQKINNRTQLVAMGVASNALGTVNDIAKARELTYRYSAWLLLDAVHYAPHFSIDVQSMGCDFLLCSAYKFYGPHIGLLYAKPGILDQIPTDRLRTAEQMAPYSIETGTLNHAALAGVTEAIEFIAHNGEGDDLRPRLRHAYKSIGQHERSLAEKFYNGLLSIPGVEVIGPDFSHILRAPTISFTMEGKSPIRVCEFLSEKNVCTWDGHFYAVRAIEVLGLLERGGVTRVGFSIYNTPEEVDQTLGHIQELSEN